MLLVLNTSPVLTSTTFSSDVLEITTFTSFPSASFPNTVLKSSISALPANLVTNLFSSEILPAIPPTWKVLNVS
ncbi:MAG: Uncharacterised protein [Flavobacteriaceae bacterium]|nr:MAG: Uncharacterised protein [Flavobacteriaceae bacterium]